MRLSSHYTGMWRTSSDLSPTNRESLINLMAVKWYGETEFWAALGKVLLIVGLIIFTFISMLGGNPLKDRYGFRYWKEPGSFAELYYTGNLGKFLGFLQCLIQASFTIAGPDYVSMAAGEAVSTLSSSRAVRRNSRTIADTRA